MKSPNRKSTRKRSEENKNVNRNHVKLSYIPILRLPISSISEWFYDYDHLLCPINSVNLMAQISVCDKIVF